MLRRTNYVSDAYIPIIPAHVKIRITISIADIASDAISNRNITTARYVHT